MPQAAYVHVPFCRQRCGYCNFSLLANRGDLYTRFLNALEVELSALQMPRSVHTLFLGGGTPSLLPEIERDRLLSLLAYWLPMDETGEWSMEANPLDITEAFCQSVRDLGVNRISIGGQSFQSAKLRILERDHSPSQLRVAIEVALKHFSSVSLDLIFAAPGENLSEWELDLKLALQSGVQHLSTYGLTFEKGARFWGMRERSEIEAIPEDTELSMYQTAIETLTKHGFEHYEISNFAKPGHACRHNQHYWQGQSWWAFGPSAARYVGDTRSVNHRGTIEYMRRIEQLRSPVDELEVLSSEQKIRERFVFGMRQLSGVDWAMLRKEADPATARSIQSAIEQHLRAGWMASHGDHIRLTREGLFISDSLWSEYL